MINVIVELSKYIILTLMIVYTFHCFYTVRQSDEEDRNELLRQQLLLIFFIDFTAFLVLYLKTFNFKIVEFYAEMLLFFAAIQILYRMLYKKASILLLNNMCMLLSVGFIMLCRLDISSAQKQLLIAAGVSAIALVIPVMIRKMRFLRRLTWVYAGIGIILLAAVFALARTSYGAKLSLLGVQPSEAIKITFVFFMASFLSRDTSFKAIVQVTVVAALHVGILSHISLWYMLQHEMLVILHLESAVVQLQQLLHIICSVMSASESAHGKILWQSIRMRDIRLCSHSLPLVPGAGSAWDYTRVLQNLSLLSRTILSSVQSVRN